MSAHGIGPRRAALIVLGASLVCALFLALPGRTITTVYVNDLFIFLDGAHRIASGQVPNRDFHTALGPLSFYLPAAGYWLSGTLGGAMPVGMAATLVLFAPILAYVTASRLHPVIAIMFGVFVALVLAVPANLGESPASLSFAMFYNRIGWAALATLLVMYLPPRREGPRQHGLDAACAASLVLLMLYLKVTYGLVALAFLAFMLFDRSERRWAALALGVTLAGCLAVEALWRSSSQHLSDLLLARAVSGSRGPVDLVLGFLRHLADYVMMGMLVVLALWRTRRLRDFLFFALAAAPGLLIMAQNSQPWGIITLHAGASVAAEMLIRSERQQGALATARWLPSVGRGAPVLLAAILLPTIVHCSATLALHAGLALGRAGESFGLPLLDRVRIAQLWSPGDHAFSKAYLTSIQDGARTLSRLDRQPSRVSVLDFANPFSAALALPPPCGDSSWLHWGRNINSVHFLPGEELLGGVTILMVPKWGINNLPLIDTYGDYIDRAFEPVAETPLWTLHRRRGPATTQQGAQGLGCR
jgi:hypothetical protein